MVLRTQNIILRTLGRVLLHVLFWCGVLLFYTFFFDGSHQKQQDVLLFSLFLMPITIATTYISIYKLIPEYLVKKRYGRFILYSTYTLIISAYLIMVSLFFSLVYLAHFEYSQMNPLTKNILVVTSVVYLVTVVVSAFKLLQLHLRQAEKAKKLETKILETQLHLKEQELNYLKMQIHPHFLFNTLNTLYGFALKKASETPEMILKLSNLLDYLLYQVDKPIVPIREEIEHIKDYIELEKLRFRDSLQVRFDHQLVSEQTSIAPMLLLPFVENSFKHGRLIDGVLIIDILLRSSIGQIDFKVQNSSVENEPSPNGIGLQNIRKRLDLLYRDRYGLEILNSENTFTVHLTLYLSSY